jgi:hypothetical protein
VAAGPDDAAGPCELGDEGPLPLGRPAVAAPAYRNRIEIGRAEVILLHSGG